MTSSSVQLVFTLELCVVPLVDGSLHLNDATERERDQPPKNMSINLTVLPLSTLHELHQGVADEIKVQEKQALMVIKDAQLTSQ